MWGLTIWARVGDLCVGDQLEIGPGLQFVSNTKNQGKTLSHDIVTIKTFGAACVKHTNAEVIGDCHHFGEYSHSDIQR